MKFLGRDVAIKDDFLNQQKCESMRKVIAENQESTALLDKHSGDYPNDTNYYNCLVSPLQYPKLHTFLYDQISKLLFEYQQQLSINQVFNKIESFNFLKYAAGKGQFDHHVDCQGKEFSRRLAIIFCLNDVDIGGELHFPSKANYIKANSVAGRVVIFPTDWTHSHFVTRPESCDRYSLVSFVHHYPTTTIEGNL